MPRRANLPDELGHAFTYADGLRVGVSPKRLRGSDLERPFRGVRMRAEAASVDDTAAPLARDRATRRRILRAARAYATIMPAHAFFAGRTAAVLLGCPVEPGADLEVGVCSPARAPRGRGVRGVKVEPHLVSLRTIEGLRVTSPASTWAMLGSQLSVRELVVVGDALVRVPRDRRGVLVPDGQAATPEQLRRAIEAGRRVGNPRLREALALIRVGSSSPLETEYRLDAHEAGLPEPSLDVEISDERGMRLGITEVVYAEQRIAVEIEGDHHRTDRRQWHRDIEKYAAYTAAGWEVIRLTSLHVRRGDAAAIVRAALIRRGWSP